jgi:hypothetical protein
MSFMILGAATTVVGAAGVLVGVLVTSLTQLWVDSRRARREQQRENARRAAEMRLAARLVVEELSEAEQMVSEAAKMGHYWRADRQLSNAVWVEHRPALAAHFPGPADWRSITSGFKELNRLNWLVNERRDQLAGGQNLPVESSDDTQAAWYEIQTAIWILESTIDMADDVTTWHARIKRQEQAHWGDSLQSGHHGDRSGL